MPFNIYINKLATTIEQISSSEIYKFLMYTDDLVLLLPIERGLQQNLSLLETHFQNWDKALTDKAHRAYYSIISSLKKLYPPIKIWLKLFRSIIQPILLYGSEI